MQNTVAKRYAEALHSLAREENLCQEILPQLETIAKAWQDNAEFRTLMTSPRVDMVRKRQILAELGYRLKFQSFMTNLFYLMLGKGRIDMVSDLADEFRKLDDQTSNRVRALCRSAQSLKNEQLTALRNKLIEIAGAQEVLINLEVEPSLLAGFTVSIDGKIIDASLKGRLQHLGRALS